MKITEDAIILESTEDRQIIWDAVRQYNEYCWDMSQSKHIAKDIFAETQKKIDSDIIIPMYETWKDIMH